MYSVDTIAGGGKTFAAIEFVAKRVAQGRKYIIAQPSQHLINMSLADLRKQYPNLIALAIHAGTYPDGVTSAIIKHMKNAAQRESGEVLFITHAALERLPDYARKYGLTKHWYLIVDEAPSPTGCHTFNNLPRGIRTAIRIIPEGVAYSRMEPSNLPLLRRIATKKTTSPKLREYVELARDLLNPHKKVYALTSQWCNVDNPNAQVSFFTLLKPSFLDDFAAKATVMSVCFADTLLYRLWTLDGIEWKTHSAITDRVRGMEHTNGPLLTVHYAVENDWSKRLRDSVAFPGSSKSELEAMRDAAKTVFKGEDFAYIVNKDSEKAVLGAGQKLPNSPHGLNEFQHLHNAVAFSALNLTPAHIKFLNSRGISSDEIRGAITYQATYQASLRISLRDPDNTDPKALVV